MAIRNFLLSIWGWQQYSGHNIHQKVSRYTDSHREEMKTGGKKDKGRL